MDLLLWITVVFIVVGFAVLTSMKKGMERKLAFITANMENEESTKKAKAESIIWWILSAAAWGVVSMFLIVWCFHNQFG
ncbi:MAG: hypothetical protein ACQEUT_19975 [Bacillota bacterium]